MRTLMGLLAVCLLACTTTTTTTTSGPATLLIGGANDDGTGFVDWHGATATPPIIMGPQGGQHVWVSVRTTRDFYASKMRFTIDMTDLDTAQEVKPGPMQFTRTLIDDGTVLQFSGITAYVKEPCKITGHHVRVHVDVSDLVGLTGSDEAVIVPNWTSGACTP